MRVANVDNTPKRAIIYTWTHSKDWDALEDPRSSPGAPRGRTGTALTVEYISTDIYSTYSTLLTLFLPHRCFSCDL
jgi:hypothetical protein